MQNSMKKHKLILNKLKIISLIPARGGSKGIKSKNLYLLGSKPLVAWSIDFSLKEKLIYRTFVSTDNKHISFYSKFYGAEIHPRSKRLAQDNSLLADTVKSFLIFLKKKQIPVDILVILEPTSPFREKNLVKNCINKMIKTNSDSIATFIDCKTHPFRTWFLNNDYPYSFSINNAWKPRQKLKPAYELDGSLYAFKVKKNLNLSNGLLPGKCCSYIVSNKNQIEIDNEKDIKYANMIADKMI